MNHQQPGQHQQHQQPLIHGWAAEAISFVSSLMTVLVTIVLLYSLGVLPVIGHAIVRYKGNEFPSQTISFDNTTILPAGTDLNLNYGNPSFPHFSFAFFETVQLNSSANCSLQASSQPQAAAAVLSSIASPDGYEAGFRVNPSFFSMVESFDLKQFAVGCIEVQKIGKAVKSASPAKPCTIEIIGYDYAIHGFLPWLWTTATGTPRFTSLNVTFDPLAQMQTATEKENENEGEATLSLVQMATVNLNEAFQRLYKVEFKLVSHEPSRPEGNVVLVLDDLEYVVHPSSMVLMAARDQSDRYGESRAKMEL